MKTIVLAMAAGSCFRCAHGGDAPAPVVPSGIMVQGSSYVSTIDGMVLEVIPGGPFLMGSDRGCYDEAPAHTVNLHGFLMDVHEVTNSQFAAFVKASGYRPQGPWMRGHGAGKDALPVRYVSWNDASAYAKWARRRLPTEAEWEKAARGTDGRPYPWGSDYEPGRACADRDITAEPCAVGSHPAGASPFGLLDMGGNVWEWVADWYDRYHYQRRGAAGPVTDPRGPADGEPPEARFVATGTDPGNEVSTRKVIRGGGMTGAGPECARTTKRMWGNPREWSGDTGFRCAVSLAPAAGEAR